MLCKGYPWTLASTQLRLILGDQMAMQEILLWAILKEIPPLEKLLLKPRELTTHFD